jgi:hypothetical protein
MDEMEKERNLKKLGEISHYALIAIWLVLIVSLISIVVSLLIITMIAMNYPPIMEMIMHLRTTKENALYNYSSTAIISAVSFIMMLFMIRFFENIRTSYTPFTLENAKILKDSSIVMLLSAGLMPITFLILASLLKQKYEINIELLLFVLALIVYCISLVFRYGALLQKESDETL